MLTGNDIGKRVIVYDPYKDKWEPCKYRLAAIDSSTETGYLETTVHGIEKTWRWPLKNIRVINVLPPVSKTS